MSRWLEYSEKYSLLTQREKIIVGLSIVFLSAYLLLIGVIEKQEAELSNSKMTLKEHKQDLANLRKQIDEIKLALQKDPNEHVKNEIKTLSAKLKVVNAELDKTLVDYIAPGQMAKELTALLETQSDVRVVGVSILAPEKINIDVEETEEGLAVPEYFRHGFEVVVSGDYFNLMSLVGKILSENNRFSVQNLAYKVTEHPTAEMTLLLVTVSDSRNVIRL